MKFKPRPLTLPLAFFVAYFLAILNTTGIPDSIWSGSMLWSGNSFGWPTEYLVAELTPHQHDQFVRWRQDIDNGFFSPGSILVKPDRVQKFSAASLVLNVTICLAAVVISAVVAEYWQRFLHLPRQIGLRSLFGFLLLLALTASFVQSSHSMTFYYLYWPLLQIFAVGAFITFALATAVFAICWCSTANERVASSPGSTRSASS